eukprot:CAMPEP_0184297886 /NCGR_PEP_ID=MMETSP1049-20130417/8755_1 /TAXON_ID=77928 /ORGANISM="Proteomonas sulcata, Strain CCMP704" /LENGTH=106 /DNA_ID=CAMNT_0026607811 /DNA_START=160 /DNA_END=477 /DNA_ORIENTATION=+
MGQAGQYTSVSSSHSSQSQGSAPYSQISARTQGWQLGLPYEMNTQGSISSTYSSMAPSLVQLPSDIMAEVSNQPLRGKIVEDVKKPPPQGFGAQPQPPSDGCSSCW